jgi:hypothetical protein
MRRPGDYGFRVLHDRRGDGFVFEKRSGMSAGMRVAGELDGSGVWRVSAFTPGTVEGEERERVGSYSCYEDARFGAMEFMRGRFDGEGL